MNVKIEKSWCVNVIGYYTTPPKGVHELWERVAEE